MFSSPEYKIASGKLHASHSVSGGWHTTDSSSWLTSFIAASTASSNAHLRQMLLPSAARIYLLVNYWLWFFCEKYSNETVFISSSEAVALINIIQRVQLLSSV